MYKLKKSKFLVLIPAFNELNNLKNFILEIKKIVPVCILDDCSKDQTHKWLLKNKINFIKNRSNLGYEKNLLNGIKRFNNYCDYIITFDADGQHKLTDLKKIINSKISTDIIICNRKNKNRFMEEVISFIFYLFYKLKDPLSGFKIYKTSILSHKSFKNVGNYFLVDYLLSLIENKRIKNIQIISKKRIDKPRVGNSFNIIIKEIRILLKIIIFKFFYN